MSKIGSYAERLRRKLQRRLRDELLNETMLRGLAHTREVLADWRQDYNGERPHTSLDGLTPNEFARRSTSDHYQNGLRL